MDTTSARAIDQCWYTVGKYVQQVYYIPLYVCYHDFSAGVGRSGMFIAIDTEIQYMKKKGVIDVYNCVRKMRFWRNFMVQTEVS